MVKPKRKRFHHGALRPALIASALQILAKHGPQALTLRAIADRAGVTHTAVYWHFANKEALFAAVAAEGFRALGQRITASIHEDADIDEKVRQVGRAYVGFALENPVQYRLMHGPELSDRKAYPELDEARSAVYLLVRGIVERGQADGILRAMSPDTAVLGLWGLAHGVALLLADLQLTDLGIRPSDNLLRQLASMLVDGIRAPR
jgi:AcrR family transcriptional regulator